MNMKVAVSGVGGAVGQSIMKALSLCSLPVEVYAIDINPRSAGLFRAHHSAVLPKLEDPGGVKSWETWLRSKQIDALIPGSDHDLLPLAEVRDDWAARGVCRVLISDLELVEACRDKAATVQALEQAGIPVPASAWDLSLPDVVSWAGSNGYPVVVKPRDGSASRNVHLAADEEELRFYFKRTPKPILQEYICLNGRTDEYTCAVFVDRSGSPIGSFSARRDLSSGATYRAEVGSWPEITDLVMEIGRALKPRGVLNVQLRLSERGPVPFELNIRCSGTTAIRSYFGYNEPEMLLRHYILGEKIEAPTPRTGYALRYWNEVFLDEPVPTTGLKDDFDRKGKVLAWP